MATPQPPLHRLTSKDLLTDLLAYWCKTIVIFDLRQTHQHLKARFERFVPLKQSTSRPGGFWKIRAAIVARKN